MIQNTVNSRSKLQADAPWDEYYRALAQRIRGLSGANGQPLQTLGVTSCLPREGVTTVAMNTAACAAAGDLGRVLVVDANLARPALAQWLCAEPSPGLADAMMGAASAASGVQETSEPNLFVLPAGDAVSRTRAGCDPALFRETLASLSSDFALIVVDLPPAAPASPCWNFAATLDGLLLVVEAERVDTETASRVKRRLIEGGAHPLGVVLNKQRTRNRWPRRSSS